MNASRSCAQKLWAFVAVLLELVFDLWTEAFLACLAHQMTLSLAVLHIRADRLLQERLSDRLFAQLAVHTLEGTGRGI